MDIAYDRPTLASKRKAIQLPKPVPFHENDENSAVNTPKGSPMQTTPFCRKEQSQINRSPMKRSRLHFSPMMEDPESPHKKRAIMSSSFDSKLQQDEPLFDLTSSRSVSRGITGSLSKSLGSKASSVRNLFVKHEKKRNVAVKQSHSIDAEQKKVLVRASMLAMILVHKPKLVILEGLMNGIATKKLEDLAQELFDFFNGHNQIKRLLDFVIRYEIKHTTNYTTLFRETSCATKLIGIVFKQEGSDFLSDILHPHIEEIATNAGDYEIDPTRLVSPELVEENRATLMKKCADILIDIKEGLDKISGKMAFIMKVIASAVESKWGENNAKISVQSFLFLRYICPCIVAPSFIQLKANERRALILVSKVLQTLSNDTQFGEKEDYMKDLNEWLVDNVGRMNMIFDNLKPLSTVDSRNNQKTAEYYKSAELLQQKILFHQHAILPLLTDADDIEEFKEAIEIFSSAKARQIIQLVADEIVGRSD